METTLIICVCFSEIHSLLAVVRSSDGRVAKLDAEGSTTDEAVIETQTMP